MKIASAKVHVLTIRNGRAQVRPRRRRLSRIDPSRTATIRRRFVAEMNKRFAKISQAIRKLVVEEDAFGLTSSFVVMQKIQLWRFRTDADKLTAYRDWLQEQVNAEVLTTDAMGKPWTAIYVESGYRKGATRAYMDVHKKDFAERMDIYEGTREEFLREAFSAPEALSKIELISTRVFEELKGVTAAMSQQMSRTLAAGLAAGQGPTTIARGLQKDVAGMTKKRARVIARTEVIHAHAEGQLDAFERLGVKEVGIMAEWSTAGDERVCGQCGSLEGEAMTVKKARGRIPLHPNCRCAWVPATGKKEEVLEYRLPEALPDTPEMKQLLETERNLAARTKELRKAYRGGDKSLRKPLMETKRRLQDVRAKIDAKALGPTAPIKPVKAPEPTVPKLTESVPKIVAKSKIKYTKQQYLDVIEKWHAAGDGAQMIRDGEEVIKKGIENVLKKKWSKKHWAYGRKYLKGAEKEARILNQALNDKSVYKGTVYRGGSYEDYEILGKLKKGDVWNQKGSWSSSTSRSVANEFVEEAANEGYGSLYTLEIESKSGVSIVDDVIREFKYQKEVILRADTKYQVTKVVDEYVDDIDATVKRIFMKEIDESIKALKLPEPVTAPAIPASAPATTAGTKFATAEDYRQYLIQQVKATKTPAAEKLVNELRIKYQTAWEKYFHMRSWTTPEAKALRKKYFVLEKEYKVAKKAIEVNVQAQRKLLDEVSSKIGECELLATKANLKTYQSVTDDVLSWIPKKREVYSTFDWVNLERYAVGRSGNLGSYNARNRFISMYVKSKQIFAHEFGHHVTYQLKGFMRAQNEFFKSRTAGEKIVDLFRGVRGKKDKWRTLDKYAGRVYADGHTPEVASVGIEWLWKNPYKVATKDPEWFNMIVSQLKGIPTKTGAEAFKVGKAVKAGRGVAGKVAKKAIKVPKSKLPRAVSIDKEYWHVTTKTAARDIKKKGFKLLETEIGGKIYGNGAYLGAVEDTKALKFYKSFIKASKRRVLTVSVKMNEMFEITVKPYQSFGKTCAQIARQAKLNSQYQAAKSRILINNRKIRSLLERQPLMSRKLEQEWLRQQGLIEYPEGAALREVMVKKGYKGIKINAKGEFSTDVGGSQLIIYDVKMLNKSI